MRSHRIWHISLLELCIVLALSTIGLVAHVGALQPVESPVADLLLPEGPESINRTLDAGGGRLPDAVQTRVDRALRGFAEETGAHWYAIDWNPVTLTPRLVTGSGIDQGIEVRNAATAERLARGFVDRSVALWRLDASRLSTEKVAHGLGKWSVHFRQIADGRPVIGSRLTVTLTDAGRVAAFGGDLWPELSAPARAALSESEAQTRAWRTMHARGAVPIALGPSDRVWTEMLGVLPASADAGYLVYRVRLAVREPAGAWMLDIDAQDGTVRQIQNMLRTADCFGTATGDIEFPGWCFGSNALPAGLLDIQIGGVGSTTTAADGSFWLPWGLEDPVPISADLQGPYVDVDNTQDPDAHFAGMLQPGVPFSLQWDDSNSRADERDVFHATTATHEFVKGIDPGWSDLDFPLPARVNLQQQCNAYWDGSSINFFHEAGNCANTGQIADVVAHEYGHGVTDYLYGPADPPSDMHEGNSDVIGNYLTNESKMGRGFYLSDCENGIRDSNNDLHWPEDLQGEGHFDGQIIAGFHWDARENLMATLGDEAGHARASALWHFARALGLPPTQPEQVWWTFLADDNDGNLDNGTPNHDALWPAADHHGFDYPEAFTDVVIHHTPLLHAAALPGQPIEIRAVIYSFAGAMNPDSIRVYYRETGAPEFDSVVMTAMAEPDTYHGLVPNFPVGTMLDYYILAADVEQNRLTRPAGAPVEFYQADVVSVYESFEFAGDWTVGAPGDYATTGLWVRCDPAGTRGGGGVQIQPEDDTTPDPGIFAWITGQYEGGGIDQSDANGRTTLLSPVYDLTGAISARLRFNAWFQSFGYPPTGANLKVDVSSDGFFWTTIYQREGMDMTPAWEAVDIDITSLFAPLGPLRVRVVMNGRTGYTIDEGGFDDLVILAPTSGSAAPDPGPAAVGPLRLALASGNPLVGNDPAQIRFALPQAADVRLRVLDPSGRVVRTLLDGRREAGGHPIAWDRRDDAGRPVGSGIYLLQLMTPEGNRSLRLILTH